VVRWAKLPRIGVLCYIALLLKRVLDNLAKLMIFIAHQNRGNVYRLEMSVHIHEAWNEGSLLSRWKMMVQWSTRNSFTKAEEVMQPFQNASPCIDDTVIAMPH
jgi:hypothetical protein